MMRDFRLRSYCKSVEQVSVSRIFHCDTVPHALPQFHNPFSSLLVQFEKATAQPPTWCRLSSSWTSCDMMWSSRSWCSDTISFEDVVGVRWGKSWSFLGSNCAIVPALGSTRQLSNLCGIYLFEGEVHRRKERSFGLLLKLLGRKFSSCFEYSGPTHCIAFTSPKT